MAECSDPSHYAWQRYFDPKARQYVGSDLADHEKHTAWYLERIVITTGRYVEGSTIDPIFERRGIVKK